MRWKVNDVGILNPGAAEVCGVGQCRTGCIDAHDKGVAVAAYGGLECVNGWEVR